MAKVKLLNPADDGRRLDRYELIGEIATGGMATVFLARLGGVGGFQRFVAIKRLHPHLANEEEFVQMFLDEARLAAGIHHPHVVPILEVGTSDRGYYLVMEYVEGDTLARIVARAFSGNEGVPRPVIVRILLDALAGLHAAHELNDERGQLLGLVHRDVSPQNILVGVDGSARITDFGVARATARLATTDVGRMKGKLAYMAPEQTRGEDLDRRTDLFAMGIILWEVLAGQRLFKADTEAATLSRILLEPIPPFSEVGAHVPSELEDVARRALERDPPRRFHTAAEMADALERAATAAARSSPTDIGIASPREVAAFVQRVMGQEIGAQRESVRAWLAQSDTSAPRVSKSGVVERHDITVKLPLDRVAEAVPESHHTLIGQGPTLPSEDSITSPRKEVMALEDVSEAASGPSEPEDLAVTVMRHGRSFEAAPLGPAFGSAGLHALPPEDPFSVPQPPIHRTRGRTIAIGAVLTLVVGLGVGWLQMRGRAESDATEGDRAAASDRAGETVSADPPAEGDGADTDEPEEEAALADDRASEAAGTTQAADIGSPPPVTKSPSPGPVKKPPPPSKPSTGAATAADPNPPEAEGAGTAEPGAAAPKGPPPQGAVDDLANPYR